MTVESATDEEIALATKVIADAASPSLDGATLGERVERGLKRAFGAGTRLRLVGARRIVVTLPSGRAFAIAPYAD